LKFSLVSRSGHPAVAASERIVSAKSMAQRGDHPRRLFR
jgi:hypothetical protein